MNDLFTPATGEWKRVSTRLRDARRVEIVIPALVLGVAAAVAAYVVFEWWWLSALIVAIAVCVGIWAWFWAARNQAAWGYAENDEDLVIASGIMWRRITLVPYGRMQYVDVTAGPLAQRFGIATVTLHTASTRTAAHIPGLPADEAARLRNRLTELGEAHGAGL